MSMKVEWVKDLEDGSAEIMLTDINPNEHRAIMQAGVIAILEKEIARIQFVQAKGKYVKKRIPVDAWEINTEKIDNREGVPAWVLDAWDQKMISHGFMKYSLEITTPEGKMTASAGDYLLKGPAGEFWFNRKDIFEQNYEVYE